MSSPQTLQNPSEPLRQEDAQEVLIDLLDCMTDDVTAVINQDSTISVPQATGTFHAKA
ncbi:hypothetical protein P7K49_035586, partial [Saguinus oedipus]